jgi:hypothetical protein
MKVLCGSEIFKQSMYKWDPKETVAFVDCGTPTEDAAEFEGDWDCSSASKISGTLVCGHKFGLLFFFPTSGHNKQDLFVCRFELWSPFHSLIPSFLHRLSKDFSFVDPHCLTQQNDLLSSRRSNLLLVPNLHY